MVSVHKGAVLPKDAAGASKPPTKVEVFEAMKTIKGLHAVEDVPSDEKAHSFALQASGDSDIRQEIYQLVVHKGWILLELHRDAQTLGDVFRNLTKAESRVARGLRASEEVDDTDDEDEDEDEDENQDKDQDEGAADGDDVGGDKTNNESSQDEGNKP